MAYSIDAVYEENETELALLIGLGPVFDENQTKK